jgi:hypothetical protein
LGLLETGRGRDFTQSLEESLTADKLFIGVSTYTFCCLTVLGLLRVIGWSEGEEAEGGGKWDEGGGGLEEGGGEDEGDVKGLRSCL